MKNYLVLIYLLSLTALVMSQNEIRPWEKLGISQTEWKMIQDNKMLPQKVDELLEDGIGISEYFRQPWVSLGLTESKWIAKRRSGLTNEDIENHVRRPAKDSTWNSKNSKIVKNDIMAMSGNGQRFSSLLLPGYQQHKNERHITGNLMVGLCGGAILWSSIESIHKKHFQGLPVFGIIVPAMVWSYIDFSIFSKQKRNDAR